MKRIYLDNGATSFPKAPGVADAMSHYILHVGCNIGRGTSKEAFQMQEIQLETREMICRLFNFDHENHVVFTQNITEALNTLIKGFLKPGDHVIISPMEHNATMRPLHDLEKKGLHYSRAKCDDEGRLTLDSIEPLIQENTRAILMVHASNVGGAIFDMEAVGKIAKAHGLRFIIDAAQTAGIVEVDFKRFSADAIAFTGHKALLGPQGTGGFVISPDFAKQVEPLILGGTGSASESEEQPNYMPDKFESGTPNTVGLCGLNAALKYIESQGIHSMQQIEQGHVECFLKAIAQLKGIRIVGPSNGIDRTAVVSLDFIDQDNAEICWLLSSRYGISTRVGMHCAPSAHKTLGTFPQGTVRFSFSPFTTHEEVTFTISAICEILETLVKSTPST